MFFAIYVLLDHRFIPFYVGSTNNVRRRVQEHRRRVKRAFSYEVLEEGDEGRFEAEEYWLAYFLYRGYFLTNRSGFAYGKERHSPETRARMSLIHKERAKDPEFRKRMSEAQKGIKRNWSDEGRKRVEGAQFKPGHSGISEAKRRDSLRSHWQTLSAEKRSEIMSRTNRKAWANRDADQRSSIGKKIAETRQKNYTPAELSAIARKNGMQLSVKRPDIGRVASERMKAWLASMTDEERKDYFKRRAAKRWPKATS